MNAQATHKKEPTLDATSPKWLAARVDVQTARDNLREAENLADGMTWANGRHADEVAEKTRFHDGTLITSSVAQVFTGTNAELIYSRCRNDGHQCTHDAREAPWSAADLAAAAKRVTARAADLADAEATLADTPSHYDAALEARKAGSRHVWWPANRNVDPRRYRYQGQPITAEELATLGVAKVRRLLVSGDILEVEL